MCNQFTFYHQFGIDTGRSKFEQQKVLFLLVDPMDQKDNDPDTIDLGAPRLAQYMHKAWKKHHKTVYWVDINLALKKALKFYQTRSNAIILHETLPAYCIPKVVMMEIGEVIYEKVHASPRLLPKISLRNDWMKELGSEVARQPDGQVLQQIKIPNQANQIQTQIMIERRPVVCRDTSHAQGATQTRSSHDSENLNVEDETNHDRTVKPVVCRDTSHAQGATQTRSSHDLNVEDETNHDRTVKPVVCRDANHAQSMLNEVDIDFRITGLPHSVVKQAENYRVREFVKKIENHLHRQSLQQDLQQNNAYNPFSMTSKKMIQRRVV